MNDHTPVPLVNLAIQHLAIADEVAAGFEAVFQSSAFVGGPDVAAFETAFAKFCEVPHCVGVANGTDAIELALRAAGLGGGDEVVVPANTFVATAEAVIRAGCRVTFVDCDPVHLLIDVGRLVQCMTDRTKAVIAVDLFGQVAPFEAITPVVGESVLLFEDAAQAQGARRNGRPAGSFGVAAGTSFYPGKNLGAYGDGGAVLTASEPIADRLRSLRNHGARGRYDHTMLGFNSRLDTLQAVVLRAKLARLSNWNVQRRVAAERYVQLLGGVDDVRLPVTLPGNDHVWHQFVVRVPNRDEVLDSLHDAGIGAGIHYPVPVHLQAPFVADGPGVGGCPVAEKAAGEILSLPIFPGITEEQQCRVADVLRRALL